MRTIKFRAKAAVNDKQANIKTGDWVYGSFIESGCDAPCIIFGDGEQIEIDKKTLGQFTGVEDTFGDDVYEGDIVQSDYYEPQFKSIAAVQYEAVENIGKFGFSGGEQDAFVFGHISIKGNIHDNSKLLTQ